MTPSRKEWPILGIFVAAGVLFAVAKISPIFLFPSPVTVSDFTQTGSTQDAHGQVLLVSVSRPLKEGESLNASKLTTLIWSASQVPDDAIFESEIPGITGKLAVEDMHPGQPVRRSQLSK